MNFLDWTTFNNIHRASSMRAWLETILRGPITPVDRCELCTMPLPRERVSARSQRLHVGSYKCKVYARMDDDSKFVKIKKRPHGAVFRLYREHGLPVELMDTLVCKDTITNDIRTEQTWWADESLIRGMYEYEMLLRKGAIGDLTRIDFLLAWCRGGSPNHANCD